jgi:probable LLM family oxidoreductase
VPPSIELGIYSFGERTPEGGTGRRVSPGERLRHLVEEIELADQVGLDVFGVGEHHRPDYVVSSPAVVLAAAAARTRCIRLTSAVSVLSSDDPVRVFQQFATLDLLSEGRAEIMAGRGSFIESFPLFGHDLADYDALFAEKLELLLALRDRERVTWSGRHRPALRDQPVYPRPEQAPLPVWIAVGGTPASVARAGRLGIPLALAIIGGEPRRFRPLVELYRESWAQGGHDPGRLELGVNAHGFLAESAQAARDAAWPPYLDTMGRIGRERGWPPPTRARFEAECDPEGPLLVGDPEQVAEKLVAQHALFGFTRYLVQLTVGSMPHAQVLRAIELLGTEVAPRVRRALDQGAAVPS